MAASLSGLSASVTRILYLTGFPKELKTKDIQAAFAEYDSVAGGFKIKWRDDTSLLIVFQDPAVAKRAYLNTVAFPPAILTASNGQSATIRPYDGPDAQTVIQTVNARGQHNSNPSRSHNPRAASMSVFPNSRSNSNSTAHPNNNNGNHQLRNNQSSTPNSQHVAIPERTDSQPSPTLPSLPSHPTLNALISSSLGEAVAGTSTTIPSDPAILTTSLQQHQESLSGPRIGDPGKRMLGAALGVRHPGLGPRVVNGSGSGSSPSSTPPQGNGIDHMRDMHRAMGGLVVAE